jgi:hypothetical protein
MTDFMFEVRFDNEAGVWVATGDNIAITTEAATFSHKRSYARFCSVRCKQKAHRGRQAKQRV